MIVIYYIDYKFYKEEYLGVLSEEEFLKHINDAHATLHYYTFDRIKKMSIDEITLEIKIALCALIDHINDKEKTGGKEIASETVASHTISYVTESENKQKNIPTEKTILKKWIGLSGLMYRGV